MILFRHLTHTGARPCLRTGTLDRQRDQSTGLALQTAQTTATSAPLPSLCGTPSHEIQEFGSPSDILAANARASRLSHTLSQCRCCARQVAQCFLVAPSADPEFALFRETHMKKSTRATINACGSSHASISPPFVKRAKNEGKGWFLVGLAASKRHTKQPVKIHQHLSRLHAHLVALTSTRHACRVRGHTEGKKDGLRLDGIAWRLPTAAHGGDDAARAARACFVLALAG